MPVYYNENDTYVAAWLRELMKEGHIPDGEIDTRSIVDVRADDLKGFGQCHFFAGIGGWPVALGLAGYADLECWTGSCPCQPFSVAGRRAGFDDARHLWPVWQKLIAERRPAIVFGEQVAAATDWLRLVRSDLAALGYAVGAMPIEAASAGADHKRDRFWFVAAAEPSREGWRGIQRSGESVGSVDERAPSQFAGSSAVGAMADANRAGLAFGPITKIKRGDLWNEGEAAAAHGDGSIAMADAERVRFTQPKGGERNERGRTFDGSESGVEWAIGADGKARRVKSGVRLLVDGFPARVGLLRGFGNAIDPRPAAAFIQASIEAAKETRLEIGLAI